MYYHFTYTSGGNPYIAKTETERDRVINKHQKPGESKSRRKTAEKARLYFAI